MQRERFLVRAYGDDINATRFGLVQLLNLISNSEHAVIVVPGFEHLKDSMLSTVLGADLAKRLIKQRAILLEEGKKISLCSALTLKNFKNANIYLALCSSKYTLQDIEELHQWRALIFVTWLPEEADEWIAKHEVKVLLDAVGG